MRRVYFMRPVGLDGPVKIGCSGNIPERLKSAGCWSPFELEVIASTEGDLDLEHRLHALFEADHERLEWFSWSPRMGEVVNAINAGTFSADTLPPSKYVGLSKVMRARCQAALA